MKNEINNEILTANNLSLKKKTSYPLRVELYTNQAGSIALYRVYHFVPYTYEPITEFEVYRK